MTSLAALERERSNLARAYASDELEAKELIHGKMEKELTMTAPDETPDGVEGFMPEALEETDLDVTAEGAPQECCGEVVDDEDRVDSEGDEEDGDVDEDD